MAFVAKEGPLPWELPDASENAWTMFEDVLLAFETSSLNFARRIVIVEPSLIQVLTGQHGALWCIYQSGLYQDFTRMRRYMALMNYL